MTAKRRRPRKEARNDLGNEFQVTPAMRSDDLLSAALAYAEAERPVLALWGVDEEGRCLCGKRDCKSVGKHPIGALFKRGHLDATTNQRKIRQAWGKHPNANIGLVPDGDLLVVDIDGDDGEEAIGRLMLPETAAVQTGKGRHLYFRCKNGGDLPKLPQVDFRFSRNGYVVAPPSRHTSGKRYKWRRGCNAAAALPLLMAPGMESVTVNFSNSVQKVREGSRNNMLTSIAGMLRSKGLQPPEIAVGLEALNSEICSPPLDSDEVERIAASVGRYLMPAETAFGTLSDVEVEEVQWLFPPYIPRGTITMLEGDPGIGKSNFANAISAAVTTHGKLSWSNARVRGTVLILSAEDDPARVLKPRLEANSADHSKIRYQREPFSLNEAGLSTLRSEMDTHNPDLVIIDPIVAYLGGDDDLNNAADMTRFLTDLDFLAREFDCAILIVRHLRKTKDGAAINQGLGSIAVAGRVRSILLLGRHPEDKDARAVVHVKSNYAEEGPAIVFRLARSDKDQPRVEWERSDDAITAFDLLTVEARSRGRPPKELEHAIEFLKGYLRDHGRTKREVEAAAEAHSITRATLRRARETLEVRMNRKGRETIWTLPPGA
ncbi:bifunctional DNA primase/polymerase [bacterium]|nr:bifunctional DNA primase/polymerase [bacterium]